MIKNLSDQQKIKLLKQLLQKSKDVEVENSCDPAFKGWKNTVERNLIKIFGKESPEFEHYQELTFCYNAGIWVSGVDYTTKHLKTFRSDYKILIESIKLYIEELEEEPDPQVQEAVDSNIESAKVFIVHGHNDGSKEKVARFISKIGYEPIILHEQASGGMTIIEKIEEYSNVGFAIVLYTPDDVGTTKVKHDNGEEPSLRARQNVVFEHGYLMAKIGRNRVMPIVKGSMELPNDISGVVYISESSWQVDLAREMKAVGYEIDFNVVMS